MEFERTIYKPIDVGQRICVLGACFVEVNTVSTYMPFPIDFLNHDNVDQLGRVSDLPNKLSLV